MKMKPFLLLLSIIFFVCSNSFPEITMIGGENIILPEYREIFEMYDLLSYDPVLMMAASVGHTEIVELLINAGAERYVEVFDGV